MKLCPKCGNPMKMDAVLCSKCGKSLDENEKRELNETADKIYNNIIKLNNEFRYIKPDQNPKVTTRGNRTYIKGEALDDSQKHFLSKLNINFNESINTIKSLNKTLLTIEQLIFNLHGVNLDGGFHYSHMIFKHGRMVVKLARKATIDFDKINQQLHILNLKVYDIKNKIEGKNLKVEEDELIIKEEDLKVEEDELIIKEEDLKVEEDELIIKEEDLKVEEDELIIKEEDLKVEEDELIIKGEVLKVEDEELKIENKIVGEQKSTEISNFDSKYHKKPIVAAILSLFLCMGQFYNGQILKGILFILVLLILISINGWLGALFIIFVIYDAYKNAKQINDNIKKGYDED
ncbi:MAG: hypothetical protein FWH29_05475 [Methanobrevibacter sp.]|nr:hypothetical protein [Methanobrevibacter sp.]